MVPKELDLGCGWAFSGGEEGERVWPVVVSGDGAGEFSRNAEREGKMCKAVVQARMVERWTSGSLRSLLLKRGLVSRGPVHTIVEVEDAKIRYDE